MRVLATRLGALVPMRHPISRSPGKDGKSYPARRAADEDEDESEQVEFLRSPRAGSAYGALDAASSSINSTSVEARLQIEMFDALASGSN